jgi:iron complex transport system ATP-binding protein
MTRPSTEPRTQDANALVFDSVSVRLGERSVLQDVSFEVAPGEVVGLVGHNGAGKTTLLRAATRVIDIEAGEITVGGRPIASLSRRELACKLATVPQDTNISFSFSAFEVVLMGRAPHQPLFGLESAEDLAHARDAMERMRISDLAGRSIQQLSGGERQLVMFARAIAQEPAILLLDEPTAFLDLRHRIDVLSAVRELAAEGGSALVVSHDLGLAARACDRLVLMSEGRVAAQGAPDQVLTSEVLRSVYGIEADIVRAPDGSPLVVPRL